MTMPMNGKLRTGKKHIDKTLSLSVETLVKIVVHTKARALLCPDGYFVQ